MPASSSVSSKSKATTKATKDSQSFPESLRAAFVPFVGFCFSLCLCASVVKNIHRKSEVKFRECPLGPDLVPNFVPALLREFCNLLPSAGDHLHHPHSAIEILRQSIL